MIDKDQMYKHILGSIPPKLPAKAVQKILDVSPAYACVLCRKHGYEILRVTEMRRIQIESLPEGLTPKAVAKIVGVTTQHARRLIQECDYKTTEVVRATNYSHRRVRPTIDWDAVDWSKQDITIAEEAGCSKQRVAQVRKARRIKPADQHGEWRSHRINLAWVQEHADWCREHYIEVIRARLPCALKSTKGVERLLREAGVKAKPVKREALPWDQIDWRLPNKTLAEVWQRPTHVFAQRRYDKNLRTAQWHRDAANDPEYKQAASAQRQLAASWRNDYGHLAENGDGEQ